MKKKVATLSLVDGSVHETELDSEIENPEKYIQESIVNNTLVKIKHPRYGEFFREEYITGNQIIDFHISDSLEK